MDILGFIYYMLYVFFDKTGRFIYKKSPLTTNLHDIDALERVDFIILNTTNTFYIFGLFLYSLDIYIYLPALGLKDFQQYLLAIMNRNAIITCISVFIAIPLYFMYFYKDKYLKYFDKFKKMGFFRTFIYSIMGLFLMILPIILLFAAI